MTKIVVGVDGSESSQEALRWAVAEAKLHGQPVEALMAWGYLDQHHVPADARHFEPDYDEADARDALAQYVTDVLGPDASDDVALRPSCDLPARALLDAGKDAAMLVVGARGRGGFASLLLGSVSQKVLHHATVPRRGDPGRPRAPPRRPARAGSSSASTGRGTLTPRSAGRSTRGAGGSASVEVVHAWHMPFVAPYPSVATDVDTLTFEKVAHEILDQAIRRAKPTAEDRVSKVMLHVRPIVTPARDRQGSGPDRRRVPRPERREGGRARLGQPSGHPARDLPGRRHPRGVDMTQIDRNGLEVLDRADCIRLLRTVSLGRIGITAGALPTILPINFRVDGDRILFRTGVGTKLDAATRGAVVAFEADDFDPMYHSGWSVVVTGVAREVEDPDDRAMYTTPRWAPGQSERLVEVSIEEISGRRLDGFQLQSGWALHDSA